MASGAGAFNATEIAVVERRSSQCLPQKESAQSGQQNGE